MKFSKNDNNNKDAPKLIFFNEKKFYKSLNGITAHGHRLNLLLDLLSKTIAIKCRCIKIAILHQKGLGYQRIVCGECMQN